MPIGNRFWGAICSLTLVYGAVMAAGFLAPYDPEFQDRAFPFAPPMRLHVIGPDGRLHARPFVYGWTMKDGTFGNYVEDRSRMHPLEFISYGGGGDSRGRRLRLFGVEPPGRVFLLGTDAFGRDQLSRLLYGGRISLFAGMLAAAISLGTGMILGVSAGFYAGWVDELIMRLAELFLALPWLYCLLALRAALPLRASTGQTLLLLLLVTGLRGWARPARLIRGIVMSAREKEYVHAARSFGLRGIHLLNRHVLPQTYGILLLQAALLIPQYVLAEVTLSFLGLGFGEPDPTWGNMLGSLQRYGVLASYWWMYIPGLILIPIFLSYHILEDAIRERVREIPSLNIQFLT